MLAALMMLTLAAPPPGPVRAEKLYQKARYEDALKALGPVCKAGGDYLTCERIRAFAHVALGQEQEALAAFARILAVDPNTTLGDDISPKIQALFSDVKRGMRELGGLELDAYCGSADSGPWALKVVTPRGVEVVSIVANIKAAGERFDAVALRAEGDAWVGEYSAPGAPGKARYFLEFSLSTGAKLYSGAAVEPKEVTVRSREPAGLTAINAVAVGDARPGPFDPDPGPTSPATESEDRILGLPKWAFWGIVGGGVVLTAVGVWAVVRLTSDPAPGTVMVGIKFEDE